jgi:adenylylsulfate kinase-like enzyme
MRNNLILIEGQEGVGKSTILRALLPHMPRAAMIDGEDLGQVNPCEMDTEFMELLWRNMAALIKNFWAAGYSTVVAGSSFDNHKGYVRFRKGLPENISIYLVHLCASKAVRDQRRIYRAKPSTKELRDWVDSMCPEDATLRDNQNGYRYIRIDNDDLSVTETVAAILSAIPEVYAAS